MSESMRVGRRQLLRGAAVLTGGVVLAGAVDLSLSGIIDGAEAAARPRIHPPSDWGSRPGTPAPTILDRRPDRLIVHHTASANTRSRTLRHAYALSRQVQSQHIARGWGDSGQHFTISRGGHIMVGRRHTLAAVQRRSHLVGVHVADHNSHALGIENEGTYTRVRPPAALVASLVASLAWLCDVYELNPYRAIIGHRDLNATECPGTMLYRLLPKIRDRVAQRLGMRTRGAATLTAEVPPEAPGPGGTRAPGGPYDHGPALGPYDSAR